MRAIIIIVSMLAITASQAKAKGGVDTVKSPCDSLAYYRAAAKKFKKLYILDHIRVASGRKYLNIVAKNPSQKVYLRGWMIRALE